MALMVDDPGRSASSPGRVRSLRAGTDSVVVSRPGQTGRMEVWSTLENRLSSGGRGVPPPSGPTGRGDDRSAACGRRILTVARQNLKMCFRAVQVIQYPAIPAAAARPRKA